ncbi:MAG: carbonic anhydrase family protein [Crocosphaera sp.]|nr:carbonic anhydrase family protein [Crocosphaera sp.]
MLNILKPSLVAVGFILVGNFPVKAQLEQSPINISSDKTIFNPSISLSLSDFNYGNSVTLNVENTGSPDQEATIQANLTVPGNTFTFDGEVYELLQFHFHTPSEHLLNGQVFPLELHLVHQDTEGDLLVINRWIEEGNFNTLLDPIFSNLPGNGDPNFEVDNFDLSGILPSSLDSFQYPGSLTTPPFTEGVQWVLFNEVLEISSSQIAAFQALFPEGDTREIQPLNDRIIQTDIENFSTVPEPTTVLGLLAFGGAGLLTSKKNNFFS